jgi:hypothetical protein
MLCWVLRMGPLPLNLYRIKAIFLLYFYCIFTVFFAASAEDVLPRAEQRWAHIQGSIGKDMQLNLYRIISPNRSAQVFSVALP